MRLKRATETVFLNKSSDVEPQNLDGGVRLLSLDGGETPEEDPIEDDLVEYNVWLDLEGNPKAYSTVDSKLVSISVREGDVSLENIYTNLKSQDRGEKTAEERIAELEAMVAHLTAELLSK